VDPVLANDGIALLNTPGRAEGPHASLFGALDPCVWKLDAYI
jgi:hypothetical protein